LLGILIFLNDLGHLGLVVLAGYQAARNIKAAPEIAAITAAD
jgi:hypothetical protein